MGKCWVDGCEERAADVWQYIDPEPAATGNAMRPAVPVCTAHHAALEKGASFSQWPDGTFVVSRG